MFFNFQEIYQHLNYLLTQFHLLLPHLVLILNQSILVYPFQKNYLQSYFHNSLMIFFQSLFILSQNLFNYFLKYIFLYFHYQYIFLLINISNVFTISFILKVFCIHSEFFQIFYIYFHFNTFFLK